MPPEAVTNFQVVHRRWQRRYWLFAPLALVVVSVGLLPLWLPDRFQDAQSAYLATLPARVHAQTPLYRSSLSADDGNWPVSPDPSATSASSAVQSPLIPQGAAGELEEHVFQRGRAHAQVAQLALAGGLALQERGHRARHVGAIDGNKTILGGGVRDAGQPRIGVWTAMAILELNGDLLEVALDQLGWGALLDDLAMVHNGDAVAKLLGLFQVVRRQQDSLAAPAQRADHVP